VFSAFAVVAGASAASAPSPVTAAALARLYGRGGCALHGFTAALRTGQIAARPAVAERQLQAVSADGAFKLAHSKNPLLKQSEPMSINSICSFLTYVKYLIGPGRQF